MVQLILAIIVLFGTGCSTVSSTVGPAFGGSFIEPIDASQEVPASPELTYELNQNKPDIGSPQYADEYDELDSNVETDAQPQEAPMGGDDPKDEDSDAEEEHCDPFEDWLHCDEEQYRC